MATKIGKVKKTKTVYTHTVYVRIGYLNWAKVKDIAGDVEKHSYSDGFSDAFVTLGVKNFEMQIVEYGKKPFETRVG